jgi:hypothetical protein
VKICTHRLGQIDLVHNEQVGLCDARSTLSGNLVSTRDVDDVDYKVGQLARVVCREIVAAGLDEEEVGVELVVEVRERHEVDRDVFADGGVRTTACFDGHDALTVSPMSFRLVSRVACERLRRESIVPRQELAVFAGEDVVGHGGYREASAELCAQREHEGSLAGANRPSNAYRERPVFPVSVLDDWHFAPEKASWAVQNLVRVSMVGGSVRARRVAVCVTVRHVTRDSTTNA